MQKDTQINISNPVFHALPRDKALCEGSNEMEMPTMKKVSFSVGAGTAFMRLLMMFYAVFHYNFMILLDRIRQKNSVELRAKRLRSTFENLGGTFVKLGQQLAGRVDLLPQKYCNELAKMMDSNKPFDFKLAVAAVEQTTGKPVHETFQAFDPKPVGSASIACVYMAVLKTGEKVAVKVRRPGVERKFMADCRALGWLLQLFELLALVRPGIGTNLVHDMRKIFSEELDFRKEMRYMEVFRKRMKKYKRNHITAPQTYAQYSSDYVLVTEFITAYRLTEVLTAVETKNEKALEVLKNDNIIPKILARRLLHSIILGTQDDVLFHGDPHPANIMVQPNNRIVMIDFGACGYYTFKKRQAINQLIYYRSLNDVTGMAESTLKMLEPIPHINVDNLLNEIESECWQVVLAHKSKNFEWYERTQIPLWIKLLEISQKYNMPVNPNTLALMRNTMMIDTVVARLYPLDYTKEFVKMRGQMGKYARRRLRKRYKSQNSKSRRTEVFLGMEETLAVQGSLMRRNMYHALNPVFQFNYMKKKSAHLGAIALRLGIGALFFTGLYQIFAIVRDGFAGQNGSVREHFMQMLLEPWFFPMCLFVLLVSLRHVLFRTNDMDERLE